ncbi:MAG: hypothetical protein RLO15_12620 [Parvibaculum sp.]
MSALKAFGDADLAEVRLARGGTFIIRCMCGKGRGECAADDRECRGRISEHPDHPSQTGYLVPGELV